MRQKLPEHEIKQLIAAAKMHDIGKVVIPDSILLKPGKLNPLEYELIKEHVKAGYEVLSTIHRYKDLAEIMIYHHERYDGSGYLLGKAGGDIPLLGDIMAIADYEGDIDALVRTSPLSEYAVECKINQFSPLDEELDVLMRQGR